MKVAIAQGLTKNFTYGPIYEDIKNFKEFFLPSMKSVSAWAERMGYDYHFFEQFIKPESLINSPDNFIEDTDEGVQICVYRYWWLKSIAQDYDLVCWIDADVAVLGNPDLISIIDPNKFNVLTRHKTYQYYDFSCEIPNGWFSATNIDRLNHLTNWLEKVLTDKRAQSDTMVTLRSFLHPSQKFNDEHLLACYVEEEGKDHVNFIDIPNRVLTNLRQSNSVTDYLNKDTMIHFAGSDKFRQYKIFKTYIYILKYLHATNKTDAHIRHAINSYTVAQLDGLYNSTVNKLKELL